MNELEPLPVEPIRNSLILTGLVLRTFSLTEADPPVHVAVAVRSPLNEAGPGVTFSVRGTLAPGATGSAIVTGASAVHPLGAGGPRLAPLTGAPDVLGEVSFGSWDDPGENVCRPGGPSMVAEPTRTVPVLLLPEESSTDAPLASSNL